ncbi:MAG: RNA polymerase factor sigma-54 [Candidatus Marinimicrobia bacterium]|nr:RNA polymerase factor sigma-54 [Candidatus Neomarinimicrobiota bacterium]
MKQKLSQQQIQKLAPLQLMIARLSQLSQIDLEHAILKEVEKNPLLEIEEDPNQKRENNIPQEDPVFTWQEYGSSVRNSTFDKLEILDIPQAEQLDFFDRLLIQIKESGMNDQEIIIAEEIIGSLDENGFLTGIPIENIAYKLSVPTESAEHVLQQVQQLGPPGIAARDLQECMLLQLQEQYEEPFIIEIIEKYYEDYITKQYDTIQKAMNISESDMQYANEQIAKLNPKPGSGHNDYMTKTIIPDILLREKNGTFYVALSETGTPAIHLSETYLNMLDKKDLDRNTKRYLTSNKQAATWFMNAIEQRKRSIIAISQSIVQHQHEFLMDRRDYPAPLVMKEVAEDTRLDISTVSRVVNGKYMQTPSGMYELKYFFSEKAGRNDGASISIRDLSQDLQNIINKENKTQPLNDEQLRAALTEKGYHIARRTVAKYREKLGIPGSGKRRKT